MLSSAYSQFPATATNYQTADSGRQETIDEQGNVQGQYSYVDPNGKTITVKYTAGKNGFQVQGDHLPVAPQGFQAENTIPKSYQQFQPIPQVQPFQPTQHGLQSFQNLNSFPRSYQQQNQLYHPQYQSPGLGQFGGQYNQQTLNKNLFTPAANPYPAASAGQYENYKKALEEEKEEAAKEAFGHSTQSFGLTGFGENDQSFDQSSHRFSTPVSAPQGLPQAPYNIQFGPDNGYTFEYNF